MLFSFQHSLPPSAYATVKAYSNFDADRDAAALETAIKTKGEQQGLGLPFYCKMEGWLAENKTKLCLKTDILISLLKDTYLRWCWISQTALMKCWPLDLCACFEYALKFVATSCWDYHWSAHFFSLDSSILQILLLFCHLRMKCQFLWQWFRTGLWIMDFCWIVGLDISSSFQLSRQLHRGSLNIFLLGFELNAHVSCINLGSKKVLETSFWNGFAVFQGQGNVRASLGQALRLRSGELKPSGEQGVWTAALQ